MATRPKPSQSLQAGQPFTLWELDVLNMMDTPMGYRDISSHLGKSFKHVKNTVWAIYRKLGLPPSPGGEAGQRQRTEAVRLAKERRLI